MEGKKTCLALLSLINALMGGEEKRRIAGRVLGELERLRGDRKRIVRKFSVKSYNDWMLSVQS